MRDLERMWQETVTELCWFESGVRIVTSKLNGEDILQHQIVTCTPSPYVHFHNEKDSKVFYYWYY